jgi:hypothetical protein
VLTWLTTAGRPRPRLPWSRPRREVLLLLLVGVAALSPVSVYTPQDQSRLCLSQAILHWRLYNDPCLSTSFDRSSYGGHLYSDKGPGLPLLELPVAEIVSLPAAQHVTTLSWKMWVIRVCSSGLALLVLSFLTGRVAEGLAPGYGGLGLVTFSLGTLVAPFASLNFGELPTAAFGFGAFLLGWKGRYALAGALAAAAMLVEYQGALLLAVVGVYVGLQGARALGRYAAGAAPLLLLLALYDTLAFGRPWHTSYGYIANDLAAQQAKGLFGIGPPHLFGLYSVFSSGGGLLVLSPVLVVAAWGLVLLGRRYRAEAALSAVVAVLFVLVDAGYFTPYGGFSPGPRFVIPALPFVCLGLGPAFAWRPRLTTGLAALSIVPSIGTMLIWPANSPLRETIWGELARIPSGLGNARFVRSLSSNALVWAGANHVEAAALVGIAAIGAFVLAFVDSPARSRGRPAPVSRWGNVAVAASLCLIAAATASAVFKYPYGDRSATSPPSYVNLVPSIAGTRVHALEGQEVDFTVTVDNPTNGQLSNVVLTLRLSHGLRLLGPPFYERGSGCVGTTTLVCNLDFLEARMSTLLRLGVVVTSAPGSTETLRATVTSEGVGSRRSADYEILVVS